MTNSIDIKVSANTLVARMGLQDLAAQIPIVGRRQLYDTAVKIVAKARKRNGAVRRPIRWASDKQRRAFFATGGFGGGIPHQGGEYSSGFTIEADEKGYTILNSHPGSTYIGGDEFGNGQSKMHEGSWPIFRQVADAEIEKLPEAVQNELSSSVKKLGF